ncbi:MAG: GntR family transcriptional regulator [Lachnospiraceae bacterium]|nr:GntR family transcriptional regulator [Lachnospiraceae bacterium]
MVQLNYRDSKPIYLQLTEGFSQLILSGALVAGESLPSIREMAAKMTINPNTIEMSYRELVRADLVEEKDGSFIVADSSKVLNQCTDELLTEFDEIARKLVYLSVEPETLKERLELLNKKGDSND